MRARMQVVSYIAAATIVEACRYCDTVTHLTHNAAALAAGKRTSAKRQALSHRDWALFGRLWCRLLLLLLRLLLPLFLCRCSLLLLLLLCQTLLLVLV